jgi:ribosomal protein S18 acetylase RimI-like enzyme
MIRRAEPSDAAALADFATRTFIDTYGAYNTADDLAAYLAEHFTLSRQEEVIADPDIITLVAEEEGALTAYAQVRRQPSPEGVAEEAAIEIWRFYVDRSQHGRGLAQRLMASTLDAARELDREGRRKVWLGVWERNPRAIAFYVKCGFRDVGPKSFLFGSELQDDRVLIAEITS